MTRAAQLQTYLLDAAAIPFAYDYHDCCTFACDWCVDQGHPDPMERWRSTYRCEGQAERLMREAGGLLPMWDLGMIDAQLPECDVPALGDVGVIEVIGVTGIEQVGGIFGGKRWHMLSPNGLFSASIAPQHVLKTWRV